MYHWRIRYSGRVASTGLMFRKFVDPYELRTWANRIIECCSFKPEGVVVGAYVGEKIYNQGHHGGLELVITGITSLERKQWQDATWQFICNFERQMNAKYGADMFTCTSRKDDHWVATEWPRRIYT